LKILQELPAKCGCSQCSKGCLCGDCSLCSNPALDKAILRNIKRASALACVFLFLGAFIYFVPVVALGASPPVSEAVSIQVNQGGNGAAPLGSIAFCYLGQGAVLARGFYYPSVALNQSSKRVCH